MTPQPRARKGQGAVEYVLITILIGVFTMMTLRHGGERVAWLWTDNCNKIGAVASAPSSAPDPTPATR